MRSNCLLIACLLCFLTSVDESRAQFVSPATPASSPRGDGDHIVPLSKMAARARELLRVDSESASESERVSNALQLLELIDQLRADPRYSRSPYLQQLHALLVNRLRIIQNRLEVAERRRRNRPPRIEIDQDVLHQLNNAAAARLNRAARPAQPADYGPLLVSLIQETISPSSWDVHGGKSTIVYYRPALALVVRAPDALHGRLGPLLGALRRE